MNLQKAREIIRLYKYHLKDIHKEEIYKWRAVKHFQDHWNIQEDDFSSMLNKSLDQTKNLLDSSLYYPKRMLLEVTKYDPEMVRHLFMDLYNEEFDLIERITTFQHKIKALIKEHFPDKNDYQDKRAVLVYLSLHYPNRYYLYKYTMFKKFVQLVDYPYQPKMGDIDNILQYLSLCNILKEEIIKDNELLKMHKMRITDSEYLDNSNHILTQDIIYAAVRHIDKFEQKTNQNPASERLVKINQELSYCRDKVVLKGSFTNHIENERENKRIGDLGELLVLQYEQERLKRLGINKEPIHIAKSLGDGLGYDIRSYNEQGEEIFIEVKTTTSNYFAPFYLTRNELECSILNKSKYLLYRLYNYDDKNNKAEFYELAGSLENLCKNPILFRVTVE